jgi:hypothetical protein
MAPRTRLWAPAAMVGVLLAVVLTPGSALALPTPTIPADVAAVFAGDALRQAEAGAVGLDADFAGASVDVVHEVFRFSADFVDGRPTTKPVRRSGSWLAGIIRGDDVLGTLLVSKPNGGPAVWAGASADLPLASALRTLTAGEILIADDPNGAYYALDGSTVRPLNSWAREAFPTAGDIIAMQTKVAAQYAAKREQAADVDGSRWWVVALIGTGVALALGTGTVVLGRRRRRVVP